MIRLETSLENIEDIFCGLNERFGKFGFCLAGNWEYKYGFLDKHLDQDGKVWLRFPFRVTKGKLDGVCNSCGATVRLEKPFVFGHLYNEGLDDEASLQLVGGLFNQFQTPIEKDAKVDPKWIDLAQEVIRHVEREMAH